MKNGLYVNQRSQNCSVRARADGARTSGRCAPCGLFGHRSQSCHANRTGSVSDSLGSTTVAANWQPQRKMSAWLHESQCPSLLDQSRRGRCLVPRHSSKRSLPGYQPSRRRPTPLEPARPPYAAGTDKSRSAFDTHPRRGSRRGAKCGELFRRISARRRIAALRIWIFRMPIT